jgi:acyl-ACP thioesterase
MYTQKYRIRMYDVDANKIAKPTGLLQEMQDAGDRQMFTEKPSYDEVYQTGKAIMLNRLDMNILEEIHLDDVLTAASWPCPARRATFLRCYGLWREEGQKQKMVAEISSQWSLVSLADRKILPIAELDMTNYTHGEYHEAAPGKFKISQDIEEEMEKVCRKQVGYSDADCNGHMNNTYYLNLLCDQIPELTAGTHRVSSLRIHYSKEAVIGETIEVYRSQPKTRTLPQGLGQAASGVPDEALRKACQATRSHGDEKKAAENAAAIEILYQFKTCRLSDGEMNVAAQIGIVPINASR